MKAAPVANDYGLEPTIPPYLKPPLQNPAKLPKSPQNWKKVLKKTTKLEYSAYCEVCKVDCNSQEVLNSHKQGKKHKKNLQKLQELITPKTTKTVKASPSKTSEIGTNDIETTQVKDAKRRTSILENEVDLETKRYRIIEAGASVEGVRTCTICNVVVNSLKVYEHHLAGQKHAAMVNKLKEAQVGEVHETKMH
ncbi:hypothetical protein HPP92_020009 [Vanilla planifolia]|uniref:Uncharacterized protein n=1 Tax=Vanilla planifolia TaxID=51239 RepID=A0A835Q3Y1_VANPL|nr:hypothetical protein HPP92_020009 [Vanilla planifolia]